MPAYNEEQNIAAAIADVIANVFAQVPEAELIVVDDGSRDTTNAIARSCAAMDARIRVLRQTNAGHGPALVTGVMQSRGTHCLLLDSDRQIGLQHFAETWSLARDRDAVLGVRRKRHDPWHRLVLTAMLRAGLVTFLGVRSSDANAPYKLVRRDIALDAIRFMPKRPRIPSVLLTVYLRRNGHRVVEQVVPHLARTAGQPSLRLRRLLSFCVAATVELLRFQRRLSHRP